MMNATSNPEAAAEQASKNYRDVTSQLGLLGLSTAIPEGVRALAEKTVGQARQVYDRSSDAFDASVATFEKSFDTAGQGCCSVQPQNHRHLPAKSELRLRSGHELGGRQRPRRHRGVASGPLAEAVG